MERAGDEPATARSPLRLRLVLAAFGMLFCAAAAGGLLWVAAAATAHRLLWLVAAAVFAAAGLVAAVDLMVIVNRLRDEHRPLR
jgi:hypothetical protein